MSYSMSCLFINLHVDLFCMKVSTKDSFQVVYSLYNHEYLGYTFESFIVKLDELGRLTLQHQNISSLNAKEFSSGLDETDFELIGLMDKMHQERVVHKFSKNGIKPKDFFLKHFTEDEKNKLIQGEIFGYLERIRAGIMKRLVGKPVFEMGSDGEPTWKALKVMPKQATVLFHFRKNDDNTHYFPTIKYDGVKLDFQYKNSYLVCRSPAWLVLEGRVFSFEKEIDGSKLQPFLNKKFIVIPQNVEKTYYEKFIAPLIASYDVYAKGFEINSEKKELTPVLRFSPLAQTSLPLFNEKDESEDSSKIVMELYYRYGNYKVRADEKDRIIVKLEEVESGYIFHRINRWKTKEEEYRQILSRKGLEIIGARISWPTSKAIDWIKSNQEFLEKEGFEVSQSTRAPQKYFLGTASIEVEITESIDWFDINAIIRFGEFLIPFKEVRKLIRKGRSEIALPNGEIAVIPNSWAEDYGEIFGFINEDDEGQPRLEKYHLALIQQIEEEDNAKVSMDQKLKQLRDFERIDPQAVPTGFKGKLRPYQKAGYDWLCFLNAYKFGGCLADDMGLGKTVQTLALLQTEKNQGKHH